MGPQTAAFASAAPIPKDFMLALPWVAFVAWIETVARPRNALTSLLGSSSLNKSAGTAETTANHLKRKARKARKVLKDTLTQSASADLKFGAGSTQSLQRCMTAL